MKLAFTTSVAAACLFAAAAFAQGQPDFSQVQIKSTPLGNNTYMLEGQGGNMVIAVGGDGVIQVDTEFAPLHDKIKAEIDRLSGGKPIKYVVNTHFHGDHTGGNGGFAKDGATVVAHRNLALRLEHGSTNGLSGQKTEPAAKDRIPKQTYTTEGQRLMVQGQTAMVQHPRNAHTDTDSYVYFPTANVIATGDIVSLGPRYPTIDYANGGSLAGIITAVETYIRLGNDQTKYVPGHGPLASRGDMQRYRDMLVGVRDAVKAQIDSGKTEDQAVAAKPLAQIGMRLGSPQMADDTMVRLSYRSLKGAKANPA
jgi:glyoxylase-like metal-dependent hydrolase (beta-lactamase superfamily II)